MSSNSPCSSLNHVAARESVKVIVEDAPIEDESSEGKVVNSLLSNSSSLEEGEAIMAVGGRKNSEGNGLEQD